MYGTGTKKMLNMLIYEILKEYSDEQHKLTQQEIIKLLKLNYGIECDRRSVKANIVSLKEMDIDISTEGGYFLATRDFEDAELRMLIDSVLFSNQLSNKQAKSLIDKLKKQGNRYFSAKVSHICNLPDLQHSDNAQILYALDAINDAITRKKKISFIYNKYGTDFKLHPRREKEYVVNPYQMVANKGRYYLVCNYDKYDDISHYRIDKMTYVKVLSEKAKPKNEIKDFAGGFNLPKHMAEHIYMFSGESAYIKFLAPNDMMDELIDWFGKDFKIAPVEREMIEVTVKSNENAFFYWALQYGAYVEVMEPKRLRVRLAETIKDMAKKYK